MRMAMDTGSSVHREIDKYDKSSTERPCLQSKGDWTSLSVLQWFLCLAPTPWDFGQIEVTTEGSLELKMFEHPEFLPALLTDCGRFCLDKTLGWSKGQAGVSQLLIALEVAPIGFRNWPNWPWPFSRMRSEGFSFNSGGLFATRCLSVRNRPQPFATDRGRALRRCHWGKLLERVSDGNVTCQIRVK